MPKQINDSNALGAIRSALGMKLPEFAEHIGHGGAMLKQIEAGRKPLGAELAEKIHSKTCVPLELVLKSRISAADRERIAEIVSAPSLQLDQRSAAYFAGSVLPGLIALLAAAAKEGKNPEVVVASMVREIQRTALRIGINQRERERIGTELVGPVLNAMEHVSKAIEGTEAGRIFATQSRKTRSPSPRLPVA